MFQIHAVTSAQSSESIEALSDHIVALLPYVDAVQIREKSRSPKAIAALLELILKQTDASQLIINDRADIAMALGLTRVHLTESSVPLGHLQKALPHFRFGRSFHSAQQIMNELPCYDYGYIGHIYPTAQKIYPPFGLEKLQNLAANRPQGQLIAIGGIDEINITNVAPYVDGVAVMSGFFAKSIEESIAHAINLRSLAMHVIA